MKEIDVVMALANHGDHIRRYELMLPNVYVQHDSEADLFAIRRSGLCDEFEVKVNRADFLKDKKKMVCYRELLYEEWKDKNWSWKDRYKQPNYKPKYEALVDGDMCVNYFWYVVIEGIASEDEIPDWAGFITIGERGLKIVKSPKHLHGGKMSFEDRYKVARKSTYRFWDLKNKTYSGKD